LNAQPLTTASRWDRIGTQLQAYVDQGIFPGFISTVYQHGQVVHHHTCGLMDIAAGLPVREDAIYRIYSMSKPVTAVALMMLFEEGRFISLDDPITPYLPAFKEMQVYAGQDESGVKLVPAERPITFRQLLTHTSGLAYGLFLGPVEDIWRQANLMPRLGTPVVPLVDVVQAISRLPLAFQPGTRWNYSVGLDVAGHLVSLLSGMPFEAFLHDRLFEPLGMADTAFYAPPEKLDRLVPMYTWNGGRLNLIDAGAASPYASPPPGAMGGSGLVSTAADYLRFARMLLNRGSLDGVRVIGRKTAELIMSNHLAPALLPWGEPFPAFGQGFGLGGSVMLDRAQAGSLTSNGTYSWGGAAFTQMFIDPQEDLAAVLMTQTMSLGGDPMPPLSEIWQRLIYQAID
jgi:CubicO group peptidase (beta-lactamase class C family)